MFGPQGLSLTVSHALTMVLRRAAWLVGAGSVIGLAGSLAAQRFIRGLLLGTDRGTLLLLPGAVLVMLATSWLATYVPVYRLVLAAQLLFAFAGLELRAVPANPVGDRHRRSPATGCDRGWLRRIVNTA